MAASSRIASVALLLLAFSHIAMSIKVQDFFPDAKSNLTKIKWVHAVNSQAKLTAALNKSDVHMLEADVNMGNDTTGKFVPIMAHDQGMASDLTLQSFIEQIMKNKTKGFKLDFKSTEAFTNGTKLIVDMKNAKLLNLTVPIWLNADIVSGPVNAGVPKVDLNAFYNGAKTVPEALLSVGWTTNDPVSIPPNATTANYTEADLKKMQDSVVAAKPTQSLTFPVRACYAANTVDGLKKLLEDTKGHDSTITIWTGKNDTVNVTKLNQLIRAVGISKVYIDVPESLKRQLDLKGSAAGVAGSLGLLLASVALAFARLV